jgi:hypothetical protein
MGIYMYPGVGAGPEHYSIIQLKHCTHTTTCMYIIVPTVTPKSGEVELHTAPMLAVASIASTARDEFGR